MSDDPIKTKFSEYLNLTKELAALRKQQKAIKDKAVSLEKEIKTYMVNNALDNISLKEGEIVLYPKKISQTFKKETIIERLAESLQDQDKAEELTNSILSNKIFLVEDKIKAVIKKQ